MGTQFNDGKHPPNGAKQRENEKSAKRDADNRKRFVEDSGLEASELPDKGRPTGHNDTPLDIARRNLPQQHGGEGLDSDADDFTGRSEGGVRGDRNLGDASTKGHGGGRGKN